MKDFKIFVSGTLAQPANVGTSGESLLGKELCTIIIAAVPL